MDTVFSFFTVQFSNTYICCKSSGIMLNDVYRYILPFCSTLYTQDVLGGVKFEPVSTAAAVNEPLAKKITLTNLITLKYGCNLLSGNCWQHPLLMLCLGLWCWVVALCVAVILSIFKKKMSVFCAKIRVFYCRWLTERTDAFRGRLYRYFILWHQMMHDDAYNNLCLVNSSFGQFW